MSVVMKKNNFIMSARIPAAFLAMHSSNESIVADTERPQWNRQVSAHSKQNPFGSTRYRA